MRVLPRRRYGPDFSSELQTMRASCERLGDTFAGLSLLFAAIAVLVVVAGLWAHAPLFAMSAGFALLAAAAFGFAARALNRARKPSAGRPPVAAPRRAPEAPARWRKAA